jgi:predicted transposase YbfD/YdcC
MIQRSVITIDKMGTQTKIVEKIIKNQADYILDYISSLENKVH